MELIAQGRTADVFDLGGGRVLRRYRTGDDVALEARIMLYLEELGYPVPHVFDADGTDLVMERVEGGTLFDEMVHEPAQYRRYGRLLGELHERLHRIAAPSWLDDTASVGDGTAVVIHRDLHPQNVILSERGPVVIDWNIATAGSAAVDAAITVILTLGADLGVDAVVAEQVEPYRALLVDAFLETCGTDPRDGLAEAIAYRLTTPNNSPAEAAWLAETASGCLDSYFLEPRAI